MYTCMYKHVHDCIVLYFTLCAGIVALCVVMLACELCVLHNAWPFLYKYQPVDLTDLIKDLSPLECRGTCIINCVSGVLPYRDEHQLEWEEMVKEREAKRREAERARQELETRHRIEARVRARQQEAEAKAKKEEEKGE